VTQASQKELNTCYKKIKETYPEMRVSFEAWQVADQACNRLGLPMDVNNAARQVAKKITELEIATGRQP
jgi:transcription initiation factor TFIIIB Brf1 subunit/transcription initiation factor TFIIB